MMYRVVAFYNIHNFFFSIFLFQTEWTREALVFLFIFLLQMTVFTLLGCSENIDK